MLLVLADDAQRTVCGDYFTSRGCDVETAGTSSQAAALLRFREYDLMVADLPSAGFGRAEILRSLSGERCKATTSVFLTAANERLQAANDSIVVLTKPQPLEMIYRAGLASPAAR